MELKGFIVGGCLVISENAEEALGMYLAEPSTKKLMAAFPSYEPKVEEHNLDETAYYFELHEIDEEDHKYIYDRKFPTDGRKLVSLKRPFAKKYREVIGYKKEVIRSYI